MTQVSLSTSTNFDGDFNAVVENLNNELTLRFDLDEPAPEGGLKVYVDSNVEQIINRLDLPTFAFNPVTENINSASLITDFSNNGFAVIIDAGATFGTITIPIFDNVEPDTFLPETFDGLVNATFTIKTREEIDNSDQNPSLEGVQSDLSSVEFDDVPVSDYTIGNASSEVLFADDISQLPQTTSDYDEAVSGDIANDPNNPLVLPLSEGTTTLSATSGGGDQEYVTVTVPEGFQLDTLVLESYSVSDVGFIGVQEGNTFTEPLDDSAERGNILGYTLFGNPRQIGTDILDEIGNGLDAIGFEGALPSGTYTFALQQLGADSDYTLAFNVSEVVATDEPVVSFTATPTTLVESEQGFVEFTFSVDGEIPEGGLPISLKVNTTDPTQLFFIDFSAGDFEFESGDGDIFSPGNFWEFKGADDGTDTGLAIVKDDDIFSVVEPPYDTINLILTANTASIRLPILDDAITEDDETVTFTLEDGTGYNVAEDNAPIPIILQDGDGSIGDGPTVSLSTSVTEVTEGQEITFIIDLDQAPPEEGLRINIASDVVASTGEFAVSRPRVDTDGDGVPDTRFVEGVTLTGVADPFSLQPNEDGSGFFLTVNEQQATLTVTVAEDGIAEGTESFTYSIIEGEDYNVDATNGSATFTINEPVVEVPVISIDTIAITFDAEDNIITPNLVDALEAGTPILSITINSSVPVPEEGLIVNINSDLANITELVNEPAFAPFAFGADFLGAIYNESGVATGFQVRLNNPNAVINLLDVGLATEEAQEFTLSVEPNDGYTISDTNGSSTVTVYNTLDQVPTPPAPPTVGISISETSLIEGETATTINFNVDGEIPPEGLVVFVDSGIRFGLGEFDLFNSIIEGGVFPVTNGNASGFYFKITEPTASITLTAADDNLDAETGETITEGIEAFSFTLEEQAGYTVASDASAVNFSIADNADSQIQVSLTTNPEILIEEERTVSIHTFSLSAPPTEAGITIAVLAEGLSEFDLANIETTGITGEIAVAESFPPQLIFTITEQTATISLPIANDGVAEGLEKAVFTLVEPTADAGYQISSQANTGSFDIYDTLNETPVIVDSQESDDTIDTAIPIGINGDRSKAIVRGEIDFNFGNNRDVDQTEDVDMYSVELQAGDRLTIDLDSIPFTNSEGFVLRNSGDLRLFNAAGEELVYNDEGSAPGELFESRRDAYIDFTVTETGTYYIGVSQAFNENYDPFVKGTGDGATISPRFGIGAGEYELEVDINPEAPSFEQFVEFDGESPDSPVVSFAAIPGTFSGNDIISSQIVESLGAEEGNAALLNFTFKVEGEIPEGGLEIIVKSDTDFTGFLDDLNSTPRTAIGGEILGAVYNADGTPAGFRVLLTSANAFFPFPVSERDTDDPNTPETIEFSLANSADYAGDAELNTSNITFYDTLEQIPRNGDIPQVGVTIDQTELIESEGTEVNFTFNVEGDIPEDGLLVYVDSETRAALGEFDVFNAEITGGLFPSGNGDASGFYFRILENTANIKLTVFDETTNPLIPPEDALEGIEEFTFSLVPSDGYTIDTNANSFTFTIKDNPDSVVIEPPEEPELPEVPTDNDGRSTNNDTIANAVPLGLDLASDNLSVTIDGEIAERFRGTENTADASEDVDMYSFALQAGQTIKIDIDANGLGDAGLGSTLDSVLRIFDAEGNELVINNQGAAPDEIFQAEGDPYLEFTAPETGTYYAGISNLGNDFYDPNVANSGSGWTFGERFAPDVYRVTFSLGDMVSNSGEQIFGTDTEDNLTGTNGDDTMRGFQGDDSLQGDAGKDFIRGNRGNDTINGDAGDDILFGGRDDDTINGGTEDDFVGGGQGNDVLSGDAGDDIIRGGQGDDSLTGGTGNDYLIGNGGSDTFVLGQGDGTDAIEDFNLEEDKIGLVEGELTFADLSITQAEANTVLSVTATGEELATLQNVNAEDLTEDLFVTVPDIVNPELPVVSFEAIPRTVSEENPDAQVIWQWTVTGEFPEEGITINFDTLGENDVIRFTEQFAADRESEFNNANIVGFEEDTGRLQILLTAPDASFVLPLINDLIEEGEQTFDFRLAEGEGYTLDPDQNSTLFTISDDNGGVGVGPTVGISASATDLAEGDPITLTFTVNGEIPPEGLQILVQSPVPGALGQFDVSDLSTLELTGIEGLPEVGDATGSSFFVTITEPTATITTSIFNDIVAEAALELPLEIVNGEEYEVDPDAASITLNLADETAPVGPTVGLTIDKSDVVEGETVTFTFNVEGDIPAEGVTVLVNDIVSAQNQVRSLTEFDVANITTTGIEGFPTAADGDSGFFVTITEPTATITVPIFDEGANEDEAAESFTFELIDGEAYEVDPDASSITLNISDVGDSNPVVSFTASTDSLNEAEGTPITFNFSVAGDFPEEGIVIRTDENFFPSTQIDFNLLDFENPEVISGIEFTDFEEISTGRFIISWTLTQPEAFINLAVFDDNLAEEDTSFTTGLLPGEGYTLDPDATTATIFVTDGVDGTGGPSVGISSEPTVVNEGDPLTITLTAEGEIPEEGLEVFVDSDIVGSIGDFITVDENGNPTVTFDGLAGFPQSNEDGSGFTAILTENTANISFDVFADGANEGAETVEFAILDGENYDIATNTEAVAITINDGGENAVFDVESGVTSVFLDLPLLEEAAGLTLVGTDSDAEPFSEEFQVGFAITEDTDFSLAPVPFTPLDGAIEHSGTITLGLGDAEATIGEFSIGFDASRVSDTASGFFVADTLEDPLGLEILFDLSSPGTINVSGENLEISEADLLLAPELATALSLPDLAGADVGDARIDATVAETMATEPVVSISIEPEVASEEDEGAAVIANFSVEGEIPEEGLSILVGGDGISLLDQVDGAQEIGFNNLAVGEFFDPETEDTELILFDNEASLVFPILNDVVQEEDRDFEIFLLENDGIIDSDYRINPNATSDTVTLIDGVGGPGFGPNVGLSFTNTELAEGEEFTINFNVDGEIPEDGLTVLVSSETPGILGEFALFDAEGNPLFETTGIAAIPEVGDAIGSSFLATLTEPDASITLSTFDDGANEGLEELSFNLVDGEIYEIDPNAGEVTFSIDDGSTALPVLSFSASTDTLNEAEETPLILNFSVAGEFPEEGVIVRFDENFFDTEQIDFNVFELENLEFVDFEETSPGRFTIDYLLSAPEGSLTTAVFNDNIAEADGTYTPGILPIPDANYTLEPDATSVTISITDGVEGTGGPVVSITAEPTELNEGDEITLTLTAEGEIPEGGIEVNVDSETAAALGDLVTTDEEGNPLIALEGFEGIPGPNADASGFIGTMIANTATITFEVFDDGAGEGAETFEFSVLDGENYDLNADASSVAITIDDSILPVFGTVDGDTIEVEEGNQLLFAGEMNDLIDASTGDGGNRIYASSGDDTLILGESDRVFGGAGDDRFFVISGGDNTMTGGEGADQFWIASAEIPESVNIITDFY